jgi:hypothetical protein
MRIAAKFRQRLEDGTLLFCSAAQSKAPRPRAALAEERNSLVAALASEHICVHVEPGGRLDTLYQQVQALRTENNL